MPYYSIKDTAEEHVQEGIHLATTPCVLCHIKAQLHDTIGGPSIPVGTMVEECTGYCLTCKEGVQAQYPSHCWYHIECLRAIDSVGGRHYREHIETLWRSTVAITPRYHPPDNKKQRTLIAVEGLRAIQMLSNSEGRHTETYESDCLLSHIPFEILNMIAYHNELHPHLRVIGESRRLLQQAYIQKHSVINGQTSKIFFNNPIYTCHTFFRGIAYMTAVSNTPFHNSSAFSGEPECIELPQKPQWLLIAFDHIAVRAFQFLESKDSPILITGHTWYRLLNIRSQTSLALQYNGLFLVSVEPSKTKALHWNVPIPIDTRNWNMCGKASKWNIVVDLTVPGLKGLLVALQGLQCILGIHAFTGVGSAYHEFSLHMRALTPAWGRLRWFYFPLQQGERLTKAWICGKDCLFPQSRLTGLVVKSSLDRFYAFGGYKQRPSLRPLTADINGAITSLVYGMKDADRVGICRIGAICASTVSPKRSLISQMDGTYNRDNLPGHLPIINAWSWRYYHTTWAPLKDLQKVQLTKSDPTWNSGCFNGAMLYYKNGKIETLGEINWEVGFEDPIYVPIEGYQHGLRRNYPLRTAQPGTESRDWVAWPTEGFALWEEPWNGEPRLVFWKQ